ncbi:hypothetical protein [Qingshengfaniella alkalisoli]|nr:hypothetical protein [Qingshengfaniella alkalisoli]
MIRFLKILLILIVLGFLGLSGYAYFGDISPNQSETRIPVELDGE